MDFIEANKIYENILNSIIEPNGISIDSVVFQKINYKHDYNNRIEFYAILQSDSKHHIDKIGVQFYLNDKDTTYEGYSYRYKIYYNADDKNINRTIDGFLIKLSNLNKLIELIEDHLEVEISKITEDLINYK